MSFTFILTRPYVMIVMTSTMNKNSRKPITTKQLMALMLAHVYSRNNINRLFNHLG